MTGLEMLMKNALGAVFKSMGVTSEEIFAKFEELKKAIPEFAQQVRDKLTSVDGRMESMETELRLLNHKVDALLSIDSDPYTLPAGKTNSVFTNGSDMSMGVPEFSHGLKDG